MISKELLPQEKRIQELYYDKDNTEITCIHDWEDKYGDFPHALQMLDNYHIALIALEKEHKKLRIECGRLEYLISKIFEAMPYMSSDDILDISIDGRYLKDIDKEGKDIIFHFSRIVSRDWDDSIEDHIIDEWTRLITIK